MSFQKSSCSRFSSCLHVEGMLGDWPSGLSFLRFLISATDVVSELSANNLDPYLTSVGESVLEILSLSANVVPPGQVTPPETLAEAETVRSSWMNPEHRLRLDPCRSSQSGLINVSRVILPKLWKSPLPYKRVFKSERNDIYICANYHQVETKKSTAGHFGSVSSVREWSVESER